MKLKKIMITALLTVSPSLMIAQNCSEILKQPSQQFINTESEKNGDTTIARVNAINIYQNCYQKKIDQLKNKLDQSGQGPLMGARGDFGDMENALNQLTDYALKITATGGTYDQIKTAYAKLYVLAFKNIFYQSYLVSSEQATSNTQLEKAQSMLHIELSQYSPDEQNQFEQYFDTFQTSLTMVQGFHSSYLAYQYALWILQSPASSTLINPVF